jgi:hypothetical protein
MQKIVFATLDESIIQKLETRLVPKLYEEIKENLGVVDNTEIMKMRKSHYQFQSSIEEMGSQLSQMAKELTHKQV